MPYQFEVYHETPEEDTHCVVLRGGSGLPMSYVKWGLSPNTGTGGWGLVPVHSETRAWMPEADARALVERVPSARLGDKCDCWRWTQKAIERGRLAAAVATTTAVAAAAAEEDYW